VDRVRKSSVGDIPVLMPDGKPSRRRGAGSRVPRWLLWLLLAAVVAGAIYVVRTRRQGRAPAPRAAQAQGDSLSVSGDSSAPTSGGTRSRPDTGRARPPR